MSGKLHPRQYFYVFEYLQCAIVLFVVQDCREISDTETMISLSLVCRRLSGYRKDFFVSIMYCLSHCLFMIRLY